MSAVDTRNISRDSLFLMADLRLEGAEALERVKVRNLSAGGMMAEGSVRVLRGSRLSVKLRNIDWVEGSVAWVQDNRFGIAFAREIDPALARVQQASVDDLSSPRYVRPSSIQPGHIGTPAGALRKI
ncbi:PilZ domain-containing protein [Erythrobacter sp. SDW2]|uniref:PilZ domain-containing protein n=1 Tax=Erythrobacter sp. SDW2 TaxID=2907154 RepID=UPI001F28B9AC|nr:PilZ domain-containing protein [Erythrobacter sp. SDW2]UIP07110.1 PilZ domain-containing protein [Erythrobacter sp. SDW2]